MTDRHVVDVAKIRLEAAANCRRGVDVLFTLKNAASKSHSPAIPRSGRPNDSKGIWAKVRTEKNRHGAQQLSRCMSPRAIPAIMFDQFPMTDATSAAKINTDT